MTKKVSDDELENVSGGSQEIQQTGQDVGQSGDAVEIENTNTSPLTQKTDR